MKALTLTQPWASLVAHNLKKIETRSWGTKYRGPLAIHAAKGGYNDDLLLMKVEPFYTQLTSVGIVSRLQMPLGGILAKCELIDVIHIDSHTQRPDNPEHAFGDYTDGRYMWILDKIVALPEPVYAKGSLGLWEWTEQVTA